MEPAPEEAVHIARALKKLRAAPVAWGPVTTAGHTPARRWVVTLDDGFRAFVKVATDHLTASWLRDEHLTYSLLRGAPFMPRYLGWYDDGRHPVLALEDLSGAEWPPPWSGPRVDQVRACLDEVHAAPAPDGTPRAADDRLQLHDAWNEVARDPEPFLGLGLCSRAWLEASLPALANAAASAELDGEALLHFDVRSDNICFREGRALLVDWNWASVGNPLLDLVAWLPSLHAERPGAGRVDPGRGRGAGLALRGIPVLARGSPADPHRASRPRDAARAGPGGAALGGPGPGPPLADLTLLAGATRCYNPGP